MSDSKKFNYITSGRRWARGWNRYEAHTINWLFRIVIVSVILGMIAGVVVGILSQFSPVMILLAMVIVSFVSLSISLGIARALIPLLWYRALNQDLEQEV